MSNNAAPRNRKERRAVAKEKSADIPLALPDWSAPTQKTLYDIAAERNAQLSGGQPPTLNNGRKQREPEIVTATINGDGSLSVPDLGQNDDDPIGPVGNALIFATTLTMLHFTLDVLVHNQYRERLDWSIILSRTLTTFPILTLLIYALHPRAKALWGQVLFLAGGAIAGCYLIYSSSEEPYFAVMKRAPPVGTLWVWSVLEMRLEVALVSLAIVAAYFLWGQYTIF